VLLVQASRVVHCHTQAAGCYSSRSGDEEEAAITFGENKVRGHKESEEEELQHTLLTHQGCTWAMDDHCNCPLLVLTRPILCTNHF
jgi:hypothetical protein